MTESKVTRQTVFSCQEKTDSTVDVTGKLRAVFADLMGEPACPDLHPDVQPDPRPDVSSCFPGTGHALPLLDAVPVTQKADFQRGK
jgi:hypothetical protein